MSELIINLCFWALYALLYATGVVVVCGGLLYMWFEFFPGISTDKQRNRSVFYAGTLIFCVLWSIVLLTALGWAFEGLRP